MRFVGRLILGLLLVIAALAAALYGYTAIRFKRTYEVASRPLALPASADSAALERGRHLATAVGKCVDCHSEDLGGKVFIDEPVIGYIVTPNLTGGSGSRVGTWTLADWDRAIRHAVAPNGKGLAIMPAEEYQYFTDADLVALVSYLQTVPKVDRELTGRTFGPMARALFVAGQLPLFPAAAVNHDSVGLHSFPEGEYLGRTGGCFSCHGATLTGGAIPGMPPGTPPAANISPTGMINWTLADFTTALRTGKRPDGSTLKDPMPWKLMGGLTDGEIEALWNYLRSGSYVRREGATAS
jgi:mono/diheme cytochrome c family protein